MNGKNYDGNLTLDEISSFPEFESVKKYFIYAGYKRSSPTMLTKLNDVASVSWSAENLQRGLARLNEAGNMSDRIFPVYSDEECEADPAKKEVTLMYFPAKTEEKKKDVILLCPGGAYVEVCSVCEGFPVSARFNELGYSTFVLSYRVNEIAILPKPMEDVAAAVRYLQANAQQFDLDPKKYVVCGFSAGGHLTAEWGTDNHGYAVYDLPKPAALFPIYPEISLKMFFPQYERDFLRTMVGNRASEEVKEEYSVDKHVSAAYPPCYISVCRDDDIVPVENSFALRDALDAVGVPCKLDLGEKGGHGYGEGWGTDQYGWIDRAVAFYEELTKSADS